MLMSEFRAAVARSGESLFPMVRPTKDVLVIPSISIRPLMRNRLTSTRGEVPPPLPRKKGPTFPRTGFEHFFAKESYHRILVKDLMRILSVPAGGLKIFAWLSNPGCFLKPKGLLSC